MKKFAGLICTIDAHMAGGFAVAQQENTSGRTNGPDPGIPRERGLADHQSGELSSPRRFDHRGHEGHQPDAGGDRQGQGGQQERTPAGQRRSLQAGTGKPRGSAVSNLCAVGNHAEGRAQNLGEILPDTYGKSGLDVTTDLQAFGLIVTAEPYFSVTRPSDAVVAENIIRQETKGFEEAIDARFDMLEGGQYTVDVPAQQLPSATADPKTPLTLLEARNAVAIAKAAGAEHYAADSLQKAETYLARAEDYLKRKQGKTPIGTAARGATQMAEDARVLTLRRKEQERIANEKQAMLDKQQKAEAEARPPPSGSQAKAQAEEDARRRAQAEADRAAAERAQAEAQTATGPGRCRPAAAMAEQQKAQAEAERQRQAAAEAIRQKEEQRQRLLDQLNQVLETKDTDRGLVVSMPDVLFDSGSYTLKPAARERLARISGIAGRSRPAGGDRRPHRQRGQRCLQPGSVGKAGGVGARLSGGQWRVD